MSVVPLGIGRPDLALCAESRLTAAEGKLPGIATNATAIANINSRMLTFTPVQQGGGAGQVSGSKGGSGAVYISWT